MRALNLSLKGDFKFIVLTITRKSEALITAWSYQCVKIIIPHECKCEHLNLSVEVLSQY